jgi:hypothetical protein
MKAMGSLDENEKRRLILKLVTQLHCAECGRPYDPHDFALVQRQPEMWVLATRCHHCNQSCQVVVYLQPEPTEVVSDLTPEETKASGGWPAITTDDVLDMHSLLVRSDGDLDLLLES